MRGNIKTAVRLSQRYESAKPSPAPCAGCGQIFLLRQYEDIPQHACKKKSYRPRHRKEYNA